MIKGDSDLDKAISIIEHWTKSNEMTINKKKCGILQLGRQGNAKSKEIKLDVKLKGFPYVQNYKYLGIKFNRNFNTSSHL